MAAGLDPKLVSCLERCVAASGDHIPVVSAIFAGHFYQLLNFRHIPLFIKCFHYYFLSGVDGVQAGLVGNDLACSPEVCFAEFLA